MIGFVYLKWLNQMHNKERGQRLKNVIELKTMNKIPGIRTGRISK